MSMVKVRIDEETINARIKEVGDQISRDYEGKTLHMIGILRGSIPFMAELAKRISVPVTEDFIRCSSYGSGTVSSGSVVIKQDLSDSIEGKDVMIIEDIVDTGNTLALLKQVMLEKKPASLKICSLLDKPSRRECRDVQPDYACFEIDNYFVVGYGLDYDQQYRNLPYIGELILD